MDVKYDDMNFADVNEAIAFQVLGSIEEQSFGLGPQILDGGHTDRY